MKFYMKFKIRLRPFKDYLRILEAPSTKAFSKNLSADALF